MKTNYLDIDDASWSTKDIARVYKAAAKFAGYPEEEIAGFPETSNRQTMLTNLEHFGKTGWVDVSSPWFVLKKIKFSSLSELSLKLTVLGLLS